MNIVHSSVSMYILYTLTTCFEQKFGYSVFHWILQKNWACVRDLVDLDINEQVEHMRAE